MSKPARNHHTWVGATVLLLDERLARQATRAQKLTIISRVTVDVVDVYCRECRRTFNADSAETECMMGPQHFGGPRRQPEPEVIEDDGWPEPHDPLAPTPGQLMFGKPD